MNSSLPCELFACDPHGVYRPATETEITEHALVLLRAAITHGPTLANPNVVTDYLKLRLGRLEHEVFGMVALDTKHRVIDLVQLSSGTIDAAAVYAREVVKTCLRLNAAAVIFYHNHPSTDPTPSQADRAITKRLQDALALVDIRVLDHFIIGGDRALSFAKEGLL